MRSAARFRTPSWTLPVGILLAALADAVASTVLAFGRADLIGDVHATPDEFAWLDIGYGAAKLSGFTLCPWLLARASSRALLVGSALAMGLTCGLSAVMEQLGPLVLLRAVQGFAGAILLVAGQAMLFWSYPARRQPLVQAIFAMAAVVAPATIAPALQGWLVDTHSWRWIFFGVLPLLLAAAGLAVLAGPVAEPSVVSRRLDWAGVGLLGAAFLAVTYVLTQGNRWDWFDASPIRWWTWAGVTSLGLFLVRRRFGRSGGPIDLTVLRDPDHAFAVAVSFVAGAVLFGSAYLIPAFAMSLLGLTPTDAGLLLFPSGGLFAATLLLSAWLVQARGKPAIATVPFGILLIMAAMGMLSGASGESGAGDLLPAVLLRGAGLGFLFLSITLIAFARLDPVGLPSGIALFSIGRQIGGLLGVAGLQTVIEYHAAADRAVLGAALTHASAPAAERIAALASLLIARGLDPDAARRAAEAMVGRAVDAQANVVAFDTAFAVIALFFVAAAPILIAIRKILAKRTP